MAGQVDRARKVFERAAAMTGVPVTRVPCGFTTASGARDISSRTRSGDHLFQPWNRDRSPDSQASRSPGVLRSQSGRTLAETARNLASCWCCWCSVGALGACSLRSREPYARAPADQHDGQPEQIWLRGGVHHALAAAISAWRALSASA
jgi:hypothetical protein